MGNSSTMSRVLILSIFFFIALPSCKRLSGSDFVPVEKVSIDPQTAYMRTGENASIGVLISPAGASNKALTWSSSNPAVAAVNESGSVSALSVGTTTIKVTATDGAKSAECALTVEAPLVSVTGIKLDKTTIIFDTKGAKQTITPAIEPNDANNKEVLWFSSDPRVATVANGVVTAVDKGTSLIIVTTKEKAKMASCTVTVSF